MGKLKTYWLNIFLKKTNKISLISLVTLIALLFLLVSPSTNILSWDVFGYYLYLPAFFIYNDLGINDVGWVQGIVDVYHNTDTLYQFAPSPIGYNVNQYSMGMTFLYLPFFLIGHCIALIMDYPTDGFSLPYQMSIWVSSLVYCLVGLVFLRKVLLHFFSDLVVAITLIIICLGTNYFHIELYNGAMPHNYLFALYSILLWLTIKWHEKLTVNYTIFIGITIGLITLIRPTEIICIFIPLLYNITSIKTIKEKWRLIYNRRKHVFLIILVAFLIGLPQLIYWKVLAGKFIYYSYINKGEGLDLLSPNFINVIFSFRKGWLIYTPVMIFALLGIYFLYKKQRHIFTMIFIFFVFNLYLISSWSSWWFANSFGQRSLMQSYAVLAIPLGAFVSNVYYSKKKYLTYFIGGIITCLIFLNIFQTWQISMGIIDGSRMTKEYYFSVFGQTSSPSKEQQELLLIDRGTTGVDVFLNPKKYRMVFSEMIDFEEENENNIVVDNAHSGIKAFKLNKDHPFSKNIKKKFKELTKTDHAWIKVSLWVYPNEKWKESKLSLISTFDYKNNSYKYRGINTDEKMNLIPNQWNKIELNYLTPEPRTIDDVFYAYAWLRGDQEILIDDLKIEVYNKIK